MQQRMRCQRKRKRTVAQWPALRPSTKLISARPCLQRLAGGMLFKPALRHRRFCLAARWAWRNEPCLRLGGAMRYYGIRTAHALYVLGIKCDITNYGM